MGRLDGQPHRLLLEQRHAEGLAEHGLEFIRIAMLRRGRGIFDRLLTVPSPQVGMHHVALDRARPHDGDLDHQS
jgi:hypothetical protein